LVISDKKEERLKKIIIEAVEQSWRNFIPEFEISPPPSPLPCKEGGINLFLHTKNNNSQNLLKFINSLSTEGFSPLNIFIWPEWWFSEEEISNFEKNKFARIHLWNRILRTETAWVVVGFTLWQMI
jgi:RsmE family RNA methyltransferase